MKNRDYKVFIQGGFYHIFNRGNGKMPIFQDEQDYRNFLKRVCLVLNLPRGILSIYSSGTNERTQIIPLPKNSIDVLFFVLMSNHFHLVLRQNTEVSISKFIHKLSTSYAMYFSKKYGHVGNLFQDQFKAVAISSDEQLLWLSAYIHTNPLKVKITKNLDLYPWSSYREYKFNLPGICNKEFFIKKFGSSEKFLKNTLGKMRSDSIYQSLTLE